MSDVFIKYLPELPVTIPAMVCETPEGDFQIYLNPALSDEAQKTACKHEIEHIEKDYGRPVNVALCEFSRHSGGDER